MKSNHKVKLHIRVKPIIILWRKVMIAMRKDDINHLVDTDHVHQKLFKYHQK